MPRSTPSLAAWPWTALLLPAVLLCSPPPLYQRLSTAEGLPSDSILSLAQDQSGSLWIGTPAGLARFDGRQVESFEVLPGPAATTLDVRALAASRDGGVWIGTVNQGLIRFRDGRFESLAAQSLPSRFVFSLAEDHAGRLWLGLVGKGGELGIWDAGRYRAVLANGAKVRSVRAIRIDSKNRAWVLAATGLLVFDGEKLTSSWPIEAIGDRMASGLALDGQGAWVGSGQGLRFVPGPGQDPQPPLLAHEMVWSIFKRRSGELLAATESGVYQIASGQARPYQIPGADLSKIPVKPMVEDREGGLWLGGHPQGALHHLRPARVERQSWPGPGILTVVEAARDGSVIGGSATGLLLRWDGNRWSRLPVPLPTAAGIADLRDDGHGGLWIGTSSAGLFHWDGRHLDPFSRANGRLGSDIVFALSPYQDGNVLAATNNTLDIVRPGQPAESMIGRQTIAVDAALASRDGSLWAALYAAGVVRVHNGKRQAIGLAEGLLDSQVGHLAEASDGSILMTTASGLNRWRNGRITGYGKAQGLREVRLTRVAADTHGFVWLGSRRGLHRVALSGLDAIDRGERQQVECLTLDASDGLPGEEVTDLRLRPDGMLIAGLPRGVAWIDTARIGFDATPTHPVVQSVTIDGVPQWGKEAVVAPGARYIDFAFTAPSFLSPARQRFRYRLAGFDPNWVDALQRHTATYSNLPPGRYQFEVKATNRDGVWSDEMASIGITVQPRWYQTWWFRLGLGLAAIGAFGLWHWQRTRELHERLAIVAAERARIARELHDTVLQGFSGLLLTLDSVLHRIAEAPEESGRRLHRAIEMAERSLREARCSIAELRHATPGERGLWPRLVAAATALTEGTTIELHCDLQGTAWVLPELAERELYRILYEAICNAAWHSKARQLWVSADFSHDVLRLEVRDDGCGFEEPAGERPGHFGIAGMRERARLIGAELTLRSGEGTTVAVELRAGRQ